MAKMNTQSTIGLKDVVIAPLTKDDDTGVTYGTIQEMAGAISMGVSPQNSDPDVQYADDIEFSRVNPDPDVQLTCEMVDIPLALQEMIFGSTIDKNGVLVDSASDTCPYFALGFRAEKSDHKYRYVWLFKVAAQLSSENYNTRQGTSINRQTQQVTFTAIKRTYDGLWRVKADEGENGFTATSGSTFLASVYEPDFTE